MYQPVAFSSSFGMEDMVILDLLEKLSLEVDVFTLDTGRLHPETHALIEQARSKYRCDFRIVHPEPAQLHEFVGRHGENAIYDSVEMRKRCCAIRKVAPLRKALQGKQLWITGLRRGQSVTRSNVRVLEFDKEFGLFKFSPLVDWSAREVGDYLIQHEVPVNALHARGYPSIGCAPCTRAIKSGEDERAGRWWWEQADSRECGLHMDPEGRLQRASTHAGNNQYVTQGHKS